MSGVGSVGFMSARALDFAIAGFVGLRAFGSVGW
jgi:hypothetical protein